MAEKKIGARTFKYERLPAFAGLAEAARAARVIAQAEDLITAMLGKGDKINIAEGASAVFRFVREADQEEVFGFIRDTLGRVRVDGMLIDEPDAYFDDKRELLTVFAWAIEVEWSDFFGDSLTALFGKAKAKLPGSGRARAA